MRSITRVIRKVLKFLIVDFMFNILGDLQKQPLIMWAMIGWGWICMLVMVTSVVYGLPDLMAAA
ncbi:MAG: hypothetical protein CMQ29_00080 [Gammaproteobacteria bacterium]|jgi:hypothetical protein|nr:hypothetical protein [Gammaproteobacteria bacterium]